jgi:hypothetical protein
MRFMTPLLGLTRPDRLRNPDFPNRLKVDNIVEDKTVSKQLVRSPERNGQNLPTEAGFSVPISGWRDVGRLHGETKNTLSFKETGVIP